MGFPIGWTDCMPFEPQLSLLSPKSSDGSSCPPSEGRLHHVSGCGEDCAPLRAVREHGLKADFISKIEAEERCELNHFGARRTSRPFDLSDSGTVTRLASATTRP